MSIFQETNIDDKSSEYFRPFSNSDIYCMPRSGLEEKVREREKEGEVGGVFLEWGLLGNYQEHCGETNWHSGGKIPTNSSKTASQSEPIESLCSHAALFQLI